MKNYNIQQNSDKEMIISFDFEKSKLIFPALFSTFILITVLTQIDFQTLQSKWPLLIFSFVILTGILFKDYFEWYKNRHHIITIENDNLLINNQLKCKLYKLKSVTICYINSNNIGWMVYLDIFPDSSHDYIIKKRLQEKEARELAKTLALFLDKEIKVE